MAEKLSVIMPAHNARETIETAIKAVLGQGCKRGFELIVVDDASTDESAEAAARAGAQVVRLEKNLGAGAARNRGAQNAKGEILVFVDSDVYLEPGCLARIDEFFEQHPDTAAVVGNYTALPEDRGACSVYHNFFTLYHHELSEPEIEWFWGAVSAVRTEAFAKLGGFSEAFPGASAEDIELGYRLSETGLKIKFRADLRGVHARKFSFGSMLYNDYHKAVLGLKLYWLRKPRGKHPHGFANPLNGFNVALAAFSWPFLLSFLLGGGFFYFFLLAVFAAANFSFYRYIHERAGGLYTIASLPLHWLCFNAIAAGTIAGVVGLTAGKGLESSSRWI